ncbi:phosphoribosyltransferase family protein [Pseudomonas sp. TNT3]|uniref:phosphoribosyltransferase n=1 Tax=Pseudomonas sp. TNT3 TaxID=2654097 RepID=UPI0013916CE0|nr:phosphoribosyltransferase family protein [Pseudomonas sp. TNT3]KAI2674703.1 phosphoribosyltransferase [Pseudomonas sp. TNT3]
MSPSSPLILQDRAAAGRRLTEPLRHYADRPDVIVLALPRGGVPVAYEVATALNLRLDLMLVRKLGVPSQPELAMGAIASGGIQILNDHALQFHPIDRAAFQAVVARETRELLRREQAYRGTRAPVQLKDQAVILIDDGLATGASMRAAIHAVRTQSPSRIVVAVPVAPVETAEALRREVDELICPITPEWFTSIGHWYMDFSQTPDAEVIRLLQRAWQPRA